MADDKLVSFELSGNARTTYTGIPGYGSGVEGGSVIRVTPDVAESLKQKGKGSIIKQQQTKASTAAATQNE